MSAAADGAPPVVLVVEDEPILLMHALFVVEQAGFEAISASSADAALAILEDREDVQVVFTDIDMPGSMDGLRLASAIRDRWPPIDLIVTSGHFNLNDDDLPKRGRFFGKPYETDAVVRALRGFTA